MMNKKSNQQLNMINARLQKLVDKMNKDYNACVQELLQCTALLQHMQHGCMHTNERLLNK